MMKNAMHSCPKKDGHRIIVNKEANPDGCPFCHERVFDDGDGSSSTAD